MAEVTYRSPGFFEAEIDLSEKAAAVPSETPAGLIGTSPFGPAFTPTRITSLSDFTSMFGDAGVDRSSAYYAAQEYFKFGSEIIFIRALGAGANTTTADITATTTKGTVKAAGFVITGSTAFVGDSRGKGCVQFITAKHAVCDLVDESYPIFVQNDSFPQASGDSTHVNLVRGVLLLASGTRVQILNESEAYSVANASDDIATIGSTSTFKLVISSSSPGYGTADGQTGIKIYTASLDPDSNNYISKILNTSPLLFQQSEHLLYTHFPVDMLLASASIDAGSIAIVSGSSNTSAASGDSTLKFNTAFGNFNTRYSAARTSMFISQPAGLIAQDLFYFETLAHGSETNTQVKVSITNLRRSDDPANPYGTFTVQVRDYLDDDLNIKILEQFSNCDLNPNSDNFIIRKIGNKKLYFNFDAVSTSERRLVFEGSLSNQSKYIRVIGTSALEKGLIFKAALPFGFEGLPVLKTSDSLTSVSTSTAISRRLELVGSVTSHTGSILPPIPLRFKVTSGDVKSPASYVGEAGDAETADPRLFWGIQFERIDTQLQPNAGARGNLIDNFVKFAGISKLDTLTTGSSAGVFCNNRFTLSRVALYNQLAPAGNLDTTITANITGTVNQHILNSAYIRNGVPDATNYTINDATLGANRLTFASLLAATDTVQFNRFTDFMKFTNVFYGGFDGTNILNPDMFALNDKSTSSEAGGLASGVYNIGLDTTANSFGTSTSNSAVSSYKSAVDIITSKTTSRINTLVIPGIRDSAITNYAAKKVKDYSLAFYIMDIPSYDDDGTRIFDTVTQPDVTKTINAFSARSINNRYVGTYFPDVTALTSTSSGTRRVRMPASVVALGALAQNDLLSYPWYAPAGFNRASLSSVTGLATRITSNDRDSLYDARINPITTFPGAGYVIFGQKDLQISKSALDRVNVVRLVIELSRRISKIGLRYVFELNNANTRARFAADITNELIAVQTQSGVDGFSVIMNETNNTSIDIEDNKLNGRVTIIPTRAVEYIAIDFIIANSGVQFI